VVGTGHEGFVLLPAAGALREGIVGECRAAGVPYV
jgi:hypothetical protein